MTNVLLVYDPLSKEFKNEAMVFVYIFLGIGLFTSLNDFIQVCTLETLQKMKYPNFQYMCFQRCCSRMMTQMRNRYIASVLRQNAGWFDKNLSGTITTRLNEFVYEFFSLIRNRVCSNMERIQEGVGDKLGVLIRGISMVTAAVIISLIYQWRLALMMFGLIPICTICMTLLSRVRFLITPSYFLSMPSSFSRRVQWRNSTKLVLLEPLQKSL